MLRKCQILKGLTWAISFSSFYCDRYVTEQKILGKRKGKSQEKSDKKLIEMQWWKEIS